MTAHRWLWPALAALAGCGDGGGGEGDRERGLPLVQVSDTAAYAADCDGEATSGTLYRHAEVEPSFAINPLDGAHRLAAWQQNRWSTGGANGIAAAVTFDGGRTWSPRELPFSRCTGGTIANGGDYSRATDPWVSFGPSGIAYWMVMTISETPTPSTSAMRVARSVDGGTTWDAPVTLIHDTGAYYNDKNAITADPNDAQYAYAVWDRLDNSVEPGRGPAYFTRTTDGGASWEAPRAIHDPGPGAQTIGNLVAVLPDGTLLNLFTELHYASSQPDGAALRVLISLDRGATWSPPITIAELLAVGTYHPDDGRPVRTGGIVASIAAGNGDDVWVAWQDSRFGPAFQGVDGIVLSHSPDGGLTWFDPVLVSPDPDVQAFTPNVAVAADGTVGIGYYDLRDDKPGDGALLTSYWLATSTDGLTWQEQRVRGPFDLEFAPNAFGLFLGDYQGLAAAGNAFVPLFVKTQDSVTNRTNVYSVAQPIAATATKAGRRARSAPVAPLSAQRERMIHAHIERSRHHFPDREKPELPGNLR